MNAYTLTDNLKLSSQELTQEGIETHTFANDYQTHLDHLKKERGYIHQDTISLNPTTPNLDAILKKFSQEHKHSLDEVRYITEGDGTFDIRSRNDRWIRIEVHQGDYLTIPAERYHRFTLNDDKKITTIRLFQDTTGWTPEYREGQ